MVFLSVLLYAIQWCARWPCHHRHAASLVSWQLFTSLFWSVSDVIFLLLLPVGNGVRPQPRDTFFFCLLRAPRRVCCGYAASQDPEDFQWMSEGRGAPERRSNKPRSVEKRNGEVGAACRAHWSRLCRVTVAKRRSSPAYYPVSIFHWETGAFPVSYVPLAERQASKGLSVAGLRAFHGRSRASPDCGIFPVF